jgi:hypothetical protein
MASTSSLVQLDVRTGAGPLAATAATGLASSTTADVLAFTTIGAATFLPAAADSSALDGRFGCGVFLAFSSVTAAAAALLGLLGFAPAMAIDCAAGGDGAFSCCFLLKQSPMVADRWIRELVEWKMEGWSWDVWSWYISRASGEVIGDFSYVIRALWSHS